MLGSLHCTATLPAAPDPLLHHGLQGIDGGLATIVVLSARGHLCSLRTSFLAAYSTTQYLI